MVDVGAVTRRMLEAGRRLPAGRAALVALSGIDASGKGWVSVRLAEALREAGRRVAVVNVDGWLNLPHVRFDPADPARHFYRYALRFEEMFGRLLLPLRDRRSLRLEAELVEETSNRFHRHTYDFEDVDLVLVEGIFLLKRELRRHYDLSVWIECSFETALQRAIARGQEGLSREETIAAYRTIYFPAQGIHFGRDEPRAAAGLVVENDPRLRRPAGRRPPPRSAALWP